MGQRRQLLRDQGATAENSLKLIRFLTQIAQQQQQHISITTTTTSNGCNNNSMRG